MARYVVAVSGGVDSVVLLDVLVKRTKPTDTIVIAHFDHGIRQGSANDAAFVRDLADFYKLPFEMKREELGLDASEELARDRRYAFLYEVAKKHKAVIVTAHHADDIIETIAINLTRGTGWRGLAVLDNPDIYRPILGRSKAEIIKYAKKHSLQWREDPTNQDTKYLRNDLRQKLVKLDQQSHDLLRLYRKRQVFLRKEVDNESLRIIGASPYSRHLLITVPEYVAMELLRAILERETGGSPTRPQLRRAIHAVKVMHARKTYEVAAGTSLRFTKKHFVVEHVPKAPSK